MLSTPYCDMTLAWSPGIFDRCGLPGEMTWRCPAEIFASRHHGPLFARIVGGVVTAPVGFSMLSASVGDRGTFYWAERLAGGPACQALELNTMRSGEL